MISTVFGFLLIWLLLALLSSMAMGNFIFAGAGYPEVDSLDEATSANQGQDSNEACARIEGFWGYKQPPYL